jgi:hypothetical protein
VPFFQGVIKELDIRFDAEATTLLRVKVRDRHLPNRGIRWKAFGTGHHLLSVILCDQTRRLSSYQSLSQEAES